MQAKNCTHILFMKSFVFKTSFSISYSIPYYHNVSSTAIFLWLPVSINWLPQIKMVSQFWEIASIWSTLYICISIMKYKRKMTSQDSNFAILSYIYLIAFLKNVVLGFNKGICQDTYWCHSSSLSIQSDSDTCILPEDPGRSGHSHRDYRCTRPSPADSEPRPSLGDTGTYSCWCRPRMCPHGDTDLMHTHWRLHDKKNEWSDDGTSCLL